MGEASDVESREVDSRHADKFAALSALTQAWKEYDAFQEAADQSTPMEAQLAAERAHATAIRDAEAAGATQFDLDHAWLEACSSERRQDTYSWICDQTTLSDAQLQALREIYGLREERVRRTAEDQAERLNGALGRLDQLVQAHTAAGSVEVPQKLNPMILDELDWDGEESVRALFRQYRGTKKPITAAANALHRGRVSSLNDVLGANGADVRKIRQIGEIGETLFNLTKNLLLVWQETHPEE
ncbi:MAG: hypothetical protein JW991_02305 [Candidatus Pacebacteria bacterium]|nr:hypothetical protein [Candidatus Paceibacterota bacterium]